MKRQIQLSLALSLLVSCGNYEEFKESFDSGINSLEPGVELNFQTVKDQVLTPRCTSCHSNYGTYENVKNNINAIVGMVRANVMPKDGPLNDGQKSLLFAWVNAGMPFNSDNTNPAPTPGPSPTPNPTPTPVPLPPEDRLTFSNVSQKVFTLRSPRLHVQPNVLDS